MHKNSTTTIKFKQVSIQDFKAVKIPHFVDPKISPEDQIKLIMLSQTVLLCTISNDCMAPHWGPRGAYVMSYQANAILKT
jgi:hypothetical protein